jgi:hypothetical protein
MSGIEDKWVAGVYLLCIGSTILCVIYGVINWNRGGNLESLPLSFLVFVVECLFPRRPNTEHLEKCFPVNDTRKG